MMKNAADVIFGGFTYWAFGYAISFGQQYTNPYFGWGNFFLQTDEENFAVLYTKFFFQASFATTSTTIVSGNIEEQCSASDHLKINDLFCCKHSSLMECLTCVSWWQPYTIQTVTVSKWIKQEIDIIILF